MSTVFLLSAALAGGATGTEVPATWSSAEVARRAEEAFREGVARRGTAGAARPYFQQAALYFEELRRRGASNPTLFRNLGNAQVLAGDLPGSILSFRRGLRLAPTDRNLRANLAEAREIVFYPSSSALGRQPLEHGPPWLPRLRADWLFHSAVACFLLAWIFLTRWLITRVHSQLVCGSLLLLAAGVTAVFLFQELLDGANRPLVVVAEDGVLLRKGNNLAFPPRYETPLNRGVEARLLFTRDDWLQIELAGGEVGWVPRGFALVDE